MKYIAIHLAQIVQIDSYKMLLKEVTKDLSKWKGNGLELHIISCQFLPNLSNYHCIQNPINLFFVEIDRMILKLKWKCEGHRIVKITLKKGSKVTKLCSGC